MSSMHSQIQHCAYYLPGKIITNSYLSEQCGIDKDFLENKIGIRERRIAGDDEPTSEMAFQAANLLFEKNGIDRKSVDLLILCTQNPDYRLPTTACIVHEKLALSKDCTAFDINLGCSGFVVSCQTAASHIAFGRSKCALVILADQYSKIIDYHDKNTAALFGDAASACLMTPCRDGTGFIDFMNGTDGSGAMQLIAFNSGVAKNTDKPPYLYMNGREIFKFAVSVIPASVNRLLERNRLKSDQIQHFIFHQANQYMLGEIKKRLGLSDAQMVIDMENYGNTVSSSIPIAFTNLLEKKAIRSGDRVVFCGFGVGLSWSTALYIQP